MRRGAAHGHGYRRGEDALRIATSDGTVIQGDVQAKRRASVVATNTIIGGNLQIEEAGASLVIENSRVDGDLQVTKAASARMRGLFINGGVELLKNTIAQLLQCKENTPAPPA